MKFVNAWKKFVSTVQIVSSDPSYAGLHDKLYQMAQETKINKFERKYIDQSINQSII